MPPPDTGPRRARYDNRTQLKLFDLATVLEHIKKHFDLLAGPIPVDQLDRRRSTGATRFGSRCHSIGLSPFGAPISSATM